MPFLLGLGVVRLVVAWDYPAFSYSRIAPDLYGFTLDQRLDLAHERWTTCAAWNPPKRSSTCWKTCALPGTDQPLYTESEIGHMIDVKNLTDTILLIVLVTGVIVVGGLLI